MSKLPAAGGEGLADRDDVAVDVEGAPPSPGSGLRAVGYGVADDLRRLPIVVLQVHCASCALPDDERVIAAVIAGQADLSPETRAVDYW